MKILGVTVLSGCTPTPTTTISPPLSLSLRRSLSTARCAAIAAHRYGRGTGVVRPTTWRSAAIGVTACTGTFSSAPESITGDAMRCPQCHQNIQVERFGVPMPPLKAAIIDRIRAAGDLGVTSTEVIADLYRDRAQVQPTTIKAHVSQINDLLAASDWLIYTTGVAGFCPEGAGHENPRHRSRYSWRTRDRRHW